jgi:hypothetical protein
VNLLPTLGAISSHDLSRSAKHSELTGAGFCLLGHTVGVSQATMKDEIVWKLRLKAAVN